MLEFLFKDVWTPIMQKFYLDQKKKFNLFFYSLLLLSFLLDFYLVQSSFAFFSYTLIFGIAMMLNEKRFYYIEGVMVWEFLLGIFGIIASFTLVTPIKWHFVPGTRIFGVFNGGIIIISYFILFYGLKQYRIVFPFLVFYGALITLNGIWGFFVNDFAEMYIAPISSHLAYFFLISLGYPVSISGTTITIISQSGTPVSATVAGACSGIEGMTLSAVMLIGLLMGSKMKYLYRATLIIIAATILFFLNALRISLIFIFAYYYGNRGLLISHQWLGNILFLIFIMLYWYSIEKYFLRRGDNKDDT